MKKVIVGSIVLVQLLNSAFSQSNNPLDREGITVINNALFIQKEIKNQRISSPDQNVIEKYNNQLRIGDLKMVTEITTKTFEAVSKPGFNAKSFIEGSKLSSKLKSELLDIIFKAGNYSADSYKSFLTKKVDSIKAVSNITPDDKDIIFRACAISYHSSEMQARGLNSGPGPNGYDDGGSAILGFTGAGIAIGAAVGAIFGAAPAGMIIGAAVGFIVGLCVVGS